MTRHNSPSRALNESLDLFTAACSDMKVSAHRIADAYGGMHDAIIQMNLAWQRMAHHAARMQGLLNRRPTQLPAYKGDTHT